jgi:antirestriction protein ArdC
VQGGVEKGSKFARENTAHVVVIGTARSSYSQVSDDVNMRRNAAELRLNIFRGSDGKMVDDVFAEAVVHAADAFEGGEAAVQDACRKVQTRVITAAAIAVLSTQASDNMLVTVLHPESSARLDALVAEMAAQPGAGPPQVLYYSPGLARISLPYSGRMGEFVDALSTFQHEGAKLEVTRVLKKDMELVFK